MRRTAAGRVLAAVPRCNKLAETSRKLYATKPSHRCTLSEVNKQIQLKKITEFSLAQLIYKLRDSLGLQLTVRSVRKLVAPNLGVARVAISYARRRRRKMTALASRPLRKSVRASSTSLKRRNTFAVVLLRPSAIGDFCVAKGVRARPMC